MSSRGLVDEAVVGDQDEGGQADDRRQLAARPGQGVAAKHDPGEDERRQPRPAMSSTLTDREGIAAAAALVPDAARPVVGLAAALVTLGSAVSEYQGRKRLRSRAADMPDQLGAVELRGVHGGDPIPE